MGDRMKYQELVDSLIRYIEDDQLEGSDQLPTVADLMLTFDVSKSTVVRSLKILEDRGIIYQRRGSGFFIREKHQRNNYFPFFHQHGHSRDVADFPYERKVLKVTITKANKNVAFNLKLKPGDGVYLVNRLSYHDNQPFVFEESYFKLDSIPHLSEEIAADSIFDYLKRKLKFKFGFTDTFLNLTKATDYVAECLELEDQSSSIFHFEDIYHLSDGTPIVYSNMYYHPDKSKFYIYGNRIEL